MFQNMFVYTHKTWLYGMLSFKFFWLQQFTVQEIMAITWFSVDSSAQCYILSFIYTLVSKKVMLVLEYSEFKLLRLS